jgi:hypothetical protein
VQQVHRLLGPAEPLGRARPAAPRQRDTLRRLEQRRRSLPQFYYDRHPTIHVPRVIGALSTRRVLTSELGGGARFAELASWPQEEREVAAETIYRFAFRCASLTETFAGQARESHARPHGDREETCERPTTRSPG